MHPPAIRAATLEDIAAIRRIAERSWAVAYRDILTPQQMAYDLAREYSPDALKAQMEAGGQTFLMLCTPEEAVGFAAFSAYPEQPKATYLNKLYLLPEYQGKGYGALLMTAVQAEGRQRGDTQLYLTVNRNNPAVAFYQKSGFHIIRELDTEIGPGFWRNDYVMARALS
jgi:ribosomal protein S18 acetylase RimI-like enzyme